MGDPFVIWAVVLLSAALILFILELFIPSMGIISAIAATSLVAGIVLLFKVNTTAGLVGALITVIGAPFVLGLVMKIWPDTPIGRLLTLSNEQQRLTSDSRHETPADGPKIGAGGTAITDLRPVGTCIIDGQRTECLADTGMIRANTPVRVVAVDGMHIKVRVDET